MIRPDRTTPEPLRDDIDRVLIPRQAIAERVSAIGQAMASDLAHAMDGQPGHAPGGRAALVPILTGAMVFTADLIRHLPVRLSVEPISVSSYPGQSTESRGASIRGAVPRDLAGRHVVIIDDILDSGQTLGLVRAAIAEQRPASLRICVLLSKPARRVVPLEPDYMGFEIPDEFVVGYGLDYDGQYRNLPDVCVLRPSVFAPSA
jgi:hypoxanthine phosphoribosyltransferase